LGLNFEAGLLFHCRMKTLLPARLVAVLPAVCLAVDAIHGADLPKPSEARECLVYLGTYTGPKSKGIYVGRLDVGSGRLSRPELAAETENPTFLAVHPSLPALYAAERPLLYAANEVRNGTVSAYSVNRENGKLTLLNRQSSRGDGPCHLSVDRLGQNVLVANYGGGNIAVLPVGRDGRLGEATAFMQHEGSSVNKPRQEKAHAHWIDAAPNGGFALVCDLGLDKVMIYQFDPAKGALMANEPAFATVKPGSGPRHLAFHPDGRFAYVINEMSNTVTAFAYDAQRGALQELQTVPTLPAAFEGRSTTAEIEVHPSGRFLYGSNRGHDSIAVFAIDPVTGKLTAVEHHPSQGKMPRNFAVDRTGRWLLAANQDSDNVVVFRIDPQTGRLTATGQAVAVGKPVCVKFIPVK
jgi:6-phosphogluconolactonase